MELRLKSYHPFLSLLLLRPWWSLFYFTFYPAGGRGRPACRRPAFLPFDKTEQAAPSSIASSPQYSVVLAEPLLNTNLTRFHFSMIPTQLCINGVTNGGLTCVLSGGGARRRRPPASLVIACALSVDFP